MKTRSRTNISLTLAAVAMTTLALTVTSAHAEMIGPGSGIGGTNFDTIGATEARINVEPVAVSLAAGSYNVLDTSFAARQTADGELRSFLAVLDSASPLSYKTIWVSDRTTPASGDTIHTVPYAVGTEQFTLGAAADVYAGAWHNGTALVGFATLGTITAHSNSSPEPTTAGDIVDTISHSTLGNRTYAYHVTVMPVPEPSTLAMAILGLAGLLGWGWRKMR